MTDSMKKQKLGIWITLYVFSTSFLMLVAIIGNFRTMFLVSPLIMPGITAYCIWKRKLTVDQKCKAIGAAVVLGVMVIDIFALAKLK